jgi:hypothetical protein
MADISLLPSCWLIGTDDAADVEPRRDGYAEDDNTTVGEGCEGGEDELITVAGCEKIGLGGEGGDCALEAVCWP